MSVHGMKPLFTDYKGYQEWRQDWRGLYAHASLDIRESKAQIKALGRKFAQYADPLDRMLDPVRARISELRAEHRYKRATGRKLMTVLEEAKIRWNNIKAMRQSIKDQALEFPTTIETRNIDFHFNKKSLEFDFIPMWVVKARGKTFYVNHVECQTGFTTRETPDHPSTKGSIRIKRGTLNISVEGIATII